MSSYSIGSVLLFLNVFGFSKTDVISNRYCPDMKPQNYVAIEQLMGMWYGVEIISHKHQEERLGIQYVDSCPVFHISEDNSLNLPTYYRGSNTNHPYGTNYGTPYQDNQYPTNQYPNTQDVYNPNTYQGTTYYGQNTQYGRTQPHRSSTYYQGRRFGNDEYPRRDLDERRLRLMWSEDGSYIEYNLRYNLSKPGFWISSGPYNGSALEPKYNQFAGAIQVIKAVGNQLVLTLCHQLPEQQLQTFLLSRVPRLTRHEVSDIHDLLHKRGLETHNIKKVCSQNGTFVTRPEVVLLTMGVIASVLTLTFHS